MRSPLRYPGGKQRSAAQFVEMFPEKVTRYIEPMVGGGSVFVQAYLKYGANTLYWINDSFYDLTCFWFDALYSNDRLVTNIQQFKERYNTPEKLREWHKSLEGKTLTPRELAINFFVLNRCTFSGTTQAGGLSNNAIKHRFTDSSINRVMALREISANAQVNVTNMDYSKLINSVQPDGTFYYFDPPYATAQKLYGKNGKLHDFNHALLADKLKTLHHKFFLTYDDCPEIRMLYTWANVRTYEKRYSMDNCGKSGKTKLAEELIITNY